MVDFIQVFTDMFRIGGETLVSWVSSFIPQVVCLMTAVNAIVEMIGEEKVETFCSKMTGNFLCRYLFLPIVAVLCVANPMACSFGRFVEEKYKPAYYDAAISFVHPVTGIFPHANAGELFVYMGIASGIQKLGLPLTDLAIRYFLAGCVIMVMRGLITEWIYRKLKRES